MLPYFFVYFCVLFLSSLLSFRNKFSGFYRPVLNFSILIAFISLFYLRDMTIGIDTYTYYEIFIDTDKFRDINDIIDYSLKYNYELGFIFISTLLTQVGGPNLTFLVYSILIFANYAVALKKININPVLYYLSFFSYFGIYLWSFNILRQMVAVSFVVLGTMYLLQNRNRFFVLFVVLASFFHYSALICLIFLVFKAKLDLFYRLRYFLILIAIFLSKFFLLLISNYYDRYSTYATVSNLESISVFLLIFYLITFLLNSFFENKIYINKEENKLLVVIFSFYIALQLSFIINDISNYGTTRILIYFLWPAVFIWGIFFKNIKDLNIRSILILLFSAFLVFYWFVSINGAGYDIVPFRYAVF